MASTVKKDDKPKAAKAKAPKAPKAKAPKADHSKTLAELESRASKLMAYSPLEAKNPTDEQRADHLLSLASRFLAFPQSDFYAKGKLKSNISTEKKLKTIQKFI